MIASSRREEDGLVDMLLRKDADVSIKNNLGQVWLFHSAYYHRKVFEGPFFHL